VVLRQVRMIHDGGDPAANLAIRGNRQEQSDVGVFEEGIGARVEEATALDAQGRDPVPVAAIQALWEPDEAFQVASARHRNHTRRRRGGLHP
jgi:hypothetical protein